MKVRTPKGSSVYIFVRALSLSLDMASEVKHDPTTLIKRISKEPVRLMFGNCYSYLLEAISEHNNGIRIDDLRTKLQATEQLYYTIANSGLLHDNDKRREDWQDRVNAHAAILDELDVLLTLAVKHDEIRLIPLRSSADTRRH